MAKRRRSRTKTAKAVRTLRTIESVVCPCQSDVEDPGPHIPSCPWINPEYVG
jgi:hypothetical protein